MIDAGNLDRLIVIQRSTEVIDTGGTLSFTWTALASLRAELVEASSQETQGDSGAQTEHHATFRMWFYPGITVADRILFEGRTYDIKESKEIGRRAGLELKAVATGLN